MSTTSATSLNPTIRVAVLAVSLASASLACAVHARAADAPTPSKHQLMKECMAKQKASEAGRSKDEMKKTCEDLAKTEKQNADNAKKP